MDPRSEHIFKRTDLRDSDSWFPTSLLTCCMLHGSQVPPLSAIFRHPPLLLSCCMGLGAHRFLLYSDTHPSFSYAAWVSPPAASCPVPCPFSKPLLAGLCHHSAYFMEGAVAAATRILPFGSGVGGPHGLTSGRSVCGWPAAISKHTLCARWPSIVTHILE